MTSTQFDNAQNSEFSLLLSECLDDIGYSIDRIHRRKEMNQTLDEIYNRKGFSATCITSGAKGEGNALYFESDIDRMFVLNDIDSIVPNEKYSATTVFHLETVESSAGYTRLKLFHPGKIECTRDDVRKFLVEENSGIYISNKFTIYEQQDYLIDIYGQHVFKEQTKCGPATSYENKYIKYDIVPALSCTCADLLNNWVQRPRQYDWPSKSEINKISQSEVHVVPVSNKNSKYPDSEWRFSFTNAELYLMHSFSEPQSKLYLLVKFVTKATLKPLCGNLSTYMLKNVLLWMFEENHTDYFTMDTLLDRVVESFKRIRHHVWSESLRCYMVPDRNLLYERMTQTEREKVLKKLDVIIADRNSMFRACHKLWNALTKKRHFSDEIRADRIKRETIEDILFRKNVIFKNAEFLDKTKDLGPVWNFDPSLEGNDEFMTLDRELQSIVIPNEKERLDLGSDLEAEVIKRLSNILS